MGRWIEYVNKNETDTGFDEEFVLNDDIIEYEQLCEIDFEKIIKDNRLQKIELANYYKYSDVYESDDTITIIFDARFDDSSIRVESDKDSSVKLIWCAGYKIDNDELHDTISYSIEEEVMPELIKKLIELKQ